MSLEPVRGSKKRRSQNEKPTQRNEEYPPSAATRESLCAAVKTQHSQKKGPNESNGPASIAHFCSIRKRLLNWRSSGIAPLSFLLGMNGAIGWGGSVPGCSHCWGPVNLGAGAGDWGGGG